jgi:hypothetical protein
MSATALEFVFETLETYGDSIAVPTPSQTALRISFLAIRLLHNHNWGVARWKGTMTTALAGWIRLGNGRQWLLAVYGSGIDSAMIDCFRQIRNLELLEARSMGESGAVVVFETKR